MSNSTIGRIQPLNPPPDASQYEGTQPVLMRLAAFCNRTAPRGKGAIPRWIGRTFGKGWKTSIHTDSGCQLAVDPANLDLFVTIQKDGAWEPWVRRACQLAMQSGGVMFDVGANAGTISNETALACPDIQIKAFEPQEALAKLVTVSALLNKNDNIEVFPVAVGDRQGTVQLHLPAHALHASLMPSGESGENSVDVPLVSLDHLVETEQVPPPDFIKVDVEGGEMGVLKGATQIIAQHRPVVIFEANESSERFGYNRLDLFALFREAGDYRFYLIAPGDVLATPSSRNHEFEGTYREIPNG